MSSFTPNHLCKQIFYHFDITCKDKEKSAKLSKTKGLMMLQSKHSRFLFKASFKLRVLAISTHTSTSRIQSGDWWNLYLLWRYIMMTNSLMFRETWETSLASWKNPQKFSMPTTAIIPFYALTRISLLRIQQGAYSSLFFMTNIQRDENW